MTAQISLVLIELKFSDLSKIVKFWIQYIGERVWDKNNIKDTL